MGHLSSSVELRFGTEAKAKRIRNHFSQREWNESFLRRNLKEWSAAAAETREKRERFS
jgi:hypothetical protein